MYAQGLPTSQLPKSTGVTVMVIVTFLLSKVHISKVCTINYMVHLVCHTITIDLHTLIGDTKRL